MMDRTPAHPEPKYWTKARIDQFVTRLHALAVRYEDQIANDYLDRCEHMRLREYRAWIAAQERENRFSWRMLKGRMMWLARQEPADKGA